MAKLVLIDGNSILNRAFFALPLLNNAQGIHTNAVYGFTTMLLKLLEEEQPTHMLVAFDAGKVTFRHEAYQDYKGGRQKTPSELSEQFPLVKEVLDAFGIPYFELENYEADDIIGTLCRRAEKEGYQVYIVTGDKDLLQLVSPKTTVLLTRKGMSEVERYDESVVKDRYGLSPRQVVDLKGLMGDASDNIPGIPGIGEKTAVKLLKLYPSVEDILAHIDELPGAKLQEKVRENQKSARLSKQLSKINCEVPIPLSFDDLTFQSYDAAKVLAVFRKLSFYSLIERLHLDEVQKRQSERGAERGVDEGMVCKEGAPTGDPTTRDLAGVSAPYHSMTPPVSHVLEEVKDLSFHRLHIEEAEGWVKNWQSMEEPPDFWLEVEEGAERTPDIAGLVVRGQEEAAFVSREVLFHSEALKNWLASSETGKRVYDSKKIQVALLWNRLALGGVSFDFLLASYLLNPSETRHALSDIAGEVGYPLTSDEEIYGKGAKRHPLSESAMIQQMLKKTQAMQRLYPVLYEALRANELMSLYEELELPLAQVLALLEVRGFKVDRERLVDMGEAFNRRLKELTEEIYQLAGVSFNINSPKQLSEVLYEKLGLPVLKKTKTGYSTSAEVLEQLAPQHEIVEKILQYRQIGKLVSTYIDGLLKEIHPKTGKIHTSFNQAITSTGRLSSTEPNLQNIPIRMEEGRRIRQAFVPSEEGWTILAADYSQIELRVLAHLSQDARLMDAFLKDKDIHAATAMDVFGVAEDEVTPNMRRQAKVVNFGIIYGISDYGLSQNLNIPRKAAALFIERYFETFPGVKRYMENVVAEAKKKGYVTTLLKRRRYLPDINHPNYNRRSFAERTAMNTPIQGSAADIIKLAMVRLEEQMRRSKMASRMLLQVHDELICEVHPDEREVLYALVRQVMEHVITLSVPLKVEVSDGPTWYDAK